MTDTVAQQMAEGGFNLAWCHETELEVAQRHHLRALLQDPLLAPASLDDPAKREKLESLVARVRNQPSLYAYFITDEPSAAQFPALGRLVAWLRQRDPAHLAYINLFPTYATNEQLGNRGDTVTAYEAHLRQYVDTVKPGLISYDHYQFTANGDSSQYFLNLGLIRQAAQEANLPFLNIVQACTWTPSMRVPKPDEMRYLVFTTLAYGAQGISYYVYSYPGHTGGIAQADGTPTSIYHALKVLNREFVAVARELQPLRSVGVYEAGMLPPGSQPLPKDLVFRLEPEVPTVKYEPPRPVKGVLLGCFGPPEARTVAPTHALVVNLDYDSSAVVGIQTRSRLEVFDPEMDRWDRAPRGRCELRLAPGGGKLVRLRR
jgi:hypothetical protein